MADKKGIRTRLKIIYKGVVVGVDECMSSETTKHIAHWGRLGFQCEEIRKEEYGKIIKQLKDKSKVNKLRIKQNRMLL